MSQSIKAILGKSRSMQIAVCAGLVATGCAPQILQPRSDIPAPVYQPPQQKQFVQPPTAQQKQLSEMVITDTPPVIVTTPPPVASKPAVIDLPPLPPIRVQEITHTVKKGDSLWKIARRYGVSINELAAYNNMNKKKVLRVGQTLLLPPGARFISNKDLPKVRRSKKSSRSYTKRSTAKRSYTAKKPLPSDGKHIVMKGDSLWKIAVQYNLKTSTLANANGLDPKNARLKIGQTLIIPGKKISSRPSAPKAPTKNNAPLTAPPIDDFPVDNTIITDNNKLPVVDDIELDPVTVGKPMTPQVPKEMELEDVQLDDPSLLTESTIPEVEIDLDPSLPPESDTLKTNVDSILDGEAATPPVKYTVTEDIDIESFTVRFGITSDALKKLNANLPADGIIKRGTTVLLPPY